MPARPPSTETNLWLSASVLVGMLGVVTFVGDWSPRVDLALWVMGCIAFAALTWLVQMRTRSLHRLPSTLSATDKPLSWHECHDAAPLGAGLNDLQRLLAESLAREREMRASVEATDRDKSDFLQSVSHELRTPLNALLGFTDVLLEELDGPLTRSQREDLEHIRRAGTYLSNLFRDVIDLAAATSAQLTVAPRHVPLRPLIEEVVSEVDAARAGRSVNVRWYVDPELDTVWADPVRLQQILGNLAHNALKFTAAGNVDVTVRSAGAREIEIAVRDSGQGIERDRLQAIFAEFERATDEDPRIEGAGLGLAITRKLVDLHHGRVEVESEVGKGSLFRVFLPRGPEPAA
ncbi:MAG: HAMP domain-containing sensor histidine kinase [Polyangiales bacterium]|nr:HAMP domain-containing histidine kinase [Myxococcales bacterium]MCB9661348.1 HAMP domain-containing histidine kinase [Sandaracinaceae bacterium]